MSEPEWEFLDFTLAMPRVDMLALRRAAGVMGIMWLLRWYRNKNGDVNFYGNQI